VHVLGVTFGWERLEVTPVGLRATEALFFYMGGLYGCVTIYIPHLKYYASRVKPVEGDGHWVLSPVTCDMTLRLITGQLYVRQSGGVPKKHI